MISKAYLKIPGLVGRQTVACADDRTITYLAGLFELPNLFSGISLHRSSESTITCCV